MTSSSIRAFRRKYPAVYMQAVIDAEMTRAHWLTHKVKLIEIERVLRCQGDWRAIEQKIVLRHIAEHVA